MKVLKFGGTSVGNIRAIENLYKVVEKATKENDKLILVCSAISGATNTLLEISELAFNDRDYSEKLKELEDKHYSLIAELLPRTLQNPLLMLVKSNFNELEDLLSSVKVVNELSERVADYIVSFGERLSSPIISAFLDSKNLDSDFVDARNFIKTDSQYGKAVLQRAETDENLQQWYKKFDKKIAIFTGFIASNKKGDTTTLGRGGSDYTAAIIGSALHAESVEIWTDVDGFMTADPKMVKNAYSLKQISYQEAMEMSYFGAKVIYPPTMIPAIEKQIPIKILNTFNPEHEGTLISKAISPGKGLIKGIVSISQVCLFNIFGNGMVGMKGFSGRLFTALSQAGVNIIFITQASSEHSISFVVKPNDRNAAIRAIEAEFAQEISDKQIEKPDTQDQLSILSVVGENMKSTRGVAGKFFSSLGKNGINIIAIAQGSSELNISAVIERKDLAKALNVVHDSLLLSPSKTFNVFCAGTGNIGIELFRQIAREQQCLKDRHNIQINIMGISNSRKMLFAEEQSLDLNHWQSNLESKSETANLSEFIERVAQLNLPNTVFLDNTSSKEVVLAYEKLFNHNISVVTCNKIANSSEFSQYLRLKQVAKKNNVSFLYETNVGAGLPIIKTLQDLVISGDEILKIEAILSGTISYIFNNYVGEKTFAEVVKQAQLLGYTEPDPRDDLNGLDFARKMLILGRETGLPLEMKDIQIVSFLPDECLKAETVETFYTALENNENYFAGFKQKAADESKKLRLIGLFENGKVEIGVQLVDANHPFYGLSGSDNIISFTTERYKATPLVVKGPGAGAAVTAAGVFSDLVRVTAV